jgi:hypothetical protein
MFTFAISNSQLIDFDKYLSGTETLLEGLKGYIIQVLKSRVNRNWIIQVRKSNMNIN